MKRYFLFGLMTALVFSGLIGCKGGKTKEFTVEEARQILAKNPPGKMMRTIHKSLVIKPVDAAAKNDVEEEKASLDKMQTAGYVTIKQSSQGGKDVYEVTITDKLKPFIINETADGAINLKVAEIVVDQVTRVTVKGEQGDVAYTVKLAPTAVSEAYPPLFNPIAGESHATFRLINGEWK